MKKQNGFISMISRMFRFVRVAVSVVVLVGVMVVITEIWFQPSIVEMIVEYTRDPWYVRAWDSVIGWF